MRFWQGNARKLVKKRGFRYRPESHIKHLMKPANRFRFTGTLPASGLSWITDFTFTLNNIHCNSLSVNTLMIFLL